MSSKTTVKKILSGAGITINGDKPWDIQVNDERFYGRALSKGSLGVGEAYMNGWWDVKELDQFFYKILRTKSDKKIRFNLTILWSYFIAVITNLQKTKAFQVGEEHYDIGNDLYEKMLDKRLTYTCGYWKDAKTLDEAQEAKLDLVCRKLNIKKGDKILDIGSGWGSFINFAAERYGAECVGLTVSKEQADYANKHKGSLPVKTLLKDYRDIEGKFDHIVSLGMFEHVGYKNYKTYMKKVASLLKDDGLFLLHTIARDTSTISPEPWIEKYIFPNAMIPSYRQISKSAEGEFVLEDWHNFGQDYDTTLMEWWKNFDNAWEELKPQYNERFYRMWKYYLLHVAGSFRARNVQLYQIVFSKKGIVGGYKSIR